MPGAYAMPATYRSATARTEALGLGLAPEGEWLDRALFGELAIADTAEELVRGTSPAVLCVAECTLPWYTTCWV
jgi:hypothetical protein